MGASAHHEQEQQRSGKARDSSAHDQTPGRAEKRAMTRCPISVSGASILSTTSTTRLSWRSAGSSLGVRAPTMRPMRSTLPDQRFRSSASRMISALWPTAISGSAYSSTSMRAMRGTSGAKRKSGVTFRVLTPLPGRAWRWTIWPASGATIRRSTISRSASPRRASALAPAARAACSATRALSCRSLAWSRSCAAMLPLPTRLCKRAASRCAARHSISARLIAARASSSSASASWSWRRAVSWSSSARR